MTQPLYGVLAQFTSSDDLLAAIRGLHQQGRHRLEACTPYAVDGLADLLGVKPSKVPLVTLLAGVAGGLTGYFLQWYAAVISYPVNIGGRPLHSWPLFIPVTFELTILCAAFGAVLAMLIGNGLPCLRHPLFDAPGFGLATQDRFFLCVRPDNSDFDAQATSQRLAAFAPVSIVEVRE